MAAIPEFLLVDEHSHYLTETVGLSLVHQGKVRNTYAINDYRLLVCASDRLSIFDFVLPALVPRKGEYLTAITHFWLTQVFRKYPHHLVAGMDADLLTYQNACPDLPISRCLLVRNLAGKMLPYEMIFRHHIGGSVYKEYLQNNGLVAEVQLPPDLAKWSKLDSPLFTPTTKEENGHDLPIAPSAIIKNEDNDIVVTINMMRDAYVMAYNYAKRRGLLILDTKLEGASNILADEIFTPDSSRYVDEEEWKKAMAENREPAFFDKETVRIWGREVETPFGIIGINNLNPENPRHVKFVHSLTVPEEITRSVSERYAIILKRLSGLSLDEYNAKRFGE